MSTQSIPIKTPSSAVPGFLISPHPRCPGTVMDRSHPHIPRAEWGWPFAIISICLHQPWTESPATAVSHFFLCLWCSTEDPGKLLLLDRCCQVCWQLMTFLFSLLFVCLFVCLFIGCAGSSCHAGLSLSLQRAASSLPWLLLWSIDSRTHGLNSCRAQA